MQTVILAGGIATRLRPLTLTLPKSMILVRQKPFLEHQLALLRAHGVTDIVLCVGHLGTLIAEYFGKGEKWGVSLSYSWETNGLLGTGGAVRNARALLNEEFLLLYGDSYLRVDYQDVIREFRKCGLPAMMVVYRNEDQWDRSNIVVRDGKIGFYSKKERWPDTVYIDAGVSAFRKEVLDWLPPEGEASLEGLIQMLIARNCLHAYETRQRFYEIGSFAGLEELERLDLPPSFQPLPD
ncbi:MAG: hypothetical protein A3G41_04200 [Elusimicrobia bacterium RIFCSPLOWO2_12_FULL_59_9]|nr:MAG: hypothetical protein A3G41_04200 [Elusimicrobia bacterium RIFCSPLOWO2_12_FULL_59_9]